ncbi:MAG: hypothetical protein HN804_04350, partial [Oceanospirillaceae bacterium]|nr:hypothetical protein [Oceanospirillaceae bacterium]
LLTSAATLVAGQAEGVATELEGLNIDIQASAHAKCERCWHHREDVGTVAAEPELCGRCNNNVHADGEVRKFA